MRCPSCDGVIEESDVQFCPFRGVQIRVSSAGKPTQRISKVIDTPTSILSSILHLPRQWHHYNRAAMEHLHRQPAQRPSLACCSAFLAGLRHRSSVRSSPSLPGTVRAVRSRHRMKGLAGVDMQPLALSRGIFNWR